MCNSKCGYNRDDKCGCNDYDYRDWNHGCCNDEFRWLERKVREIEERRRVEDRCIRQFRSCLRNGGCRNDY